MDHFLEQSFYGNTMREYLIVLAVIAGGILLIQIVKKLLLRRLERWAASTSTQTDDYLVDGLSRFGVPLLQWAIVLWAISLLKIPEEGARILRVATSVIITYYILRLLSSIVILMLHSRIRKQDRGEDKIKQLGGLIMVVNVLIWVIGIVFLFDNLGYNVATIIAGLGIGGIAVALAAQNILGDLFNYFVIYFDRPFEVGDFIIFDDKRGTVEYLGIKTTRIRSLSGEQLIIGNADLTKTRIHNYKRMFRRRVVFTFNVEYETPIEKLKVVPELVKEVIQRQSLATFDRAHFAAFNDWSLTFEAVYYVENPDYNVYMDVHQAVIFGIFEGLQKLDVRFALPVQKVVLPENVSPENGKRLV